MKKQTLASYFIVVIGSLVIMLGSYILFVVAKNARADTVSYTCTPQGKFLVSSSPKVVLTSDDESYVDTAMGWLKSMTKSSTPVVSTSTIVPDTDYSSNYQGAVAGTFTLEGRSYPTVSDAVIEITSPATLPDGYRGIVTGHVTETPEMWRWIIQVYKKDENGVRQIALQTAADGTTGDFSIDLSGVSPSEAGSWMFGILDANAGYAPHGEKWPTPAVYDGLEVQQLLITDSIYPWDSQPASADNTFSFANSNTGGKVFRLVDTSSGDILAEYLKPNGLIRSYKYEPGESGYGTPRKETSFVYDQSVALLVAIGVRDASLSKSLVDGLLLAQTKNGIHKGGIVFAVPQLTPEYHDEFYRTGAHAIATDALLAYIEAYPGDADSMSYRLAAIDALSFLETTISSDPATEGLYVGGFGAYSGDPEVFIGSTVIDWASTEHNVDAWQTLMRAGRVLDDATYTQRATSLATAITSKLYNDTEKRFNQGINGGFPDTAEPLDVNSWGAIQLYASGKVDEAKLALARLPLFAHNYSGIDGYAPFYDSPGYPGAVPSVWYEGSFGVALAMYHTGDYDGYRTLIDSLSQGQEDDGSFRYATTIDAAYDITISKSVASTAWYVLAMKGRDTMWNSCRYSPPLEEVAPVSEVPPSETDVSGSDASSGSGQRPTNQLTRQETSRNNDPATSPSEDISDPDKAGLKVASPKPVDITPRVPNENHVAIESEVEKKSDIQRMAFVGIPALIVISGAWYLIARARRG